MQLSIDDTVFGARGRDLISAKTRFFALETEGIRLKIGILR